MEVSSGGPNFPTEELMTRSTAMIALAILALYCRRSLSSIPVSTPAAHLQPTGVPAGSRPAYDGRQRISRKIRRAVAINSSSAGACWFPVVNTGPDMANSRIRRPLRRFLREPSAAPAVCLPGYEDYYAGAPLRPGGEPTKKPEPIPVKYSRVNVHRPRPPSTETAWRERTLA